MAMSEKSRELIFFVNPKPDLTKLCQVTVEVIDRTLVPTVHSKQPNIIRCRELIFTEPDLLGTPHLSSDVKFTIVMQQSLFKTGRIQGRASKLGLQLEKPKRVSALIFKECLNYSLLAKLAPAWNRMGNYLVQGRDFLQSKSKVAAIAIELNVTNEELYISVRPEVVQSHPLKITDLDICRSLIHEFMNSEEEKIEEYSIGQKWCHILPSMKKGQVVNIMHTIPKDSPFSSYKDIKKHWKNMYGYRLPETDDGTLYYQVYFKPIGETLFTYPEYCLRSRDLHIFPRTDPKPIAETFMKDLGLRLPVICGQKLQFMPEPLFVDSHLVQAEAMDDDYQVNLTCQSNEPVGGYRKYLPKPSCADNSTSISATGNRGCDQVSKVHDTDKQKSELTKESLQQNGKHIPIFRKPLMKKSNSTFSSSFTDHADKKGDIKFEQKCLPYFKSGKTKSLPVNQAVTQPSVGVALNSHVGSTFTGSNQLYEPLSASGAPFFSDSNQIVSGTVSQQDDSFSLLQRHSEDSILHSGSASTGLLDGSGLKTKCVNMVKAQGPNKNCSITSNTWTQDRTPSFEALSNSSYSVVSSSTKRPFMNSDMPNKKPRCKPQIQENIDVAALARANQLEKVNTATLQDWLKKQGVQFRAKDRKPDLMEKVIKMI